MDAQITRPSFVVRPVPKTNSARPENVSGRAAFNGDGGIRTLDTGLTPYNGLANRRLQPLGHVSNYTRVLPRRGNVAVCAGRFKRRVPRL